MRAAGLISWFACILEISAVAPISARPPASVVFTLNRQATGGKAWNAVRLVRLRGHLDVGGGDPSRIEQVVDRETGHSRTTILNGSLVDDSGFDGESWVKQNGILAIADLPSLVLDARTQAYVGRDGWWRAAGASFGAVAERVEKGRRFDVVTVTPTDGSPVTAWFDHASHLVDRLVFDADAGAITTTFSDWRTVGGVRLAFRQTSTDPSGQATTMVVDTAEVAGVVPPAALARPAAEAHGITIGAATEPVPFAFTAFDRGHVVVPVTVDGRPASVIFDSGGANYLAPKAAGRLGLTTGGGVAIGGVGAGSTIGGFAAVRRIGLGGAALTDQAVIVAPLPYVALHPRAGMSVDGLIGFEFLSEYRTTFDYGRRTVSFASFSAPREGGGVTLPFRSDGHSIYVEAAVEGVPGLFRLDTGAGGDLVVASTFARNHGLFATSGSVRTDAGGIGGTVSSRVTEADRVAFAGQTFRRVPINVSQTTAGALFSRSIAGNMGASLLARFRITFDYRARTVTFWPTEEVQRPFRRDMTGMSLGQDAADAIKVLSVVPGSPAEAAGIRAGDLIAAVDGRPVGAAGLGIFDLAASRFDDAPFELTVRRGTRTTGHVIHPHELGTSRGPVSGAPTS